MEINDMDQCFEVFIKLYKEKELMLSWRKNGTGVLSKREISNDLIDEEKFKKFLSGFTDAMSDKALENEYNHDFDKYIEKLFDIDKDLEADIFTRRTSKINICNYVDGEILTKRDKDLKFKCYSVLINLNLEKPNSEEEIYDQVNFELSIKDLKQLKAFINGLCEDINKLSEMQR